MVVYRRSAIAFMVVLAIFVAPACRFSRGSSEDKADSTSTTQDALLASGADTSTTLDGTTTTSATTVATRSGVTATRQTPQATTRVTTSARPATTRAPAAPHCNASAADTYYGSSWTANVTSTFPSSTVTIDIKWSGGSGNYSGYTDPAGSWSKTQRVQPSMRGQTINVTVTVASVRCFTSFTAS